MAENLFGCTTGMVPRNGQCILFVFCFSYLFIATSFPQNAHFWGGIFTVQARCPPVNSDLLFPPKMKSSWLIILEICCPERMTGGCQCIAHVRQKSVIAHALLPLLLFCHQTIAFPPQIIWQHKALIHFCLSSFLLLVKGSDMRWGEVRRRTVVLMFEAEFRRHLGKAAALQHWRKLWAPFSSSWSHFRRCLSYENLETLLHLSVPVLFSLMTDCKLLWLSLMGCALSVWKMATGLTGRLRGGGEGGLGQWRTPRPGTTPHTK